MNRIAILGVSLLLGASPAFAVNESVKPSYDALVAAMRDEVKTLKVRNDKGAKVEDPARRSILTAVEDAAKRNSEPTGKEDLDLIGRQFTSPAVKAALGKVRAAVDADEKAQAAAGVVKQKTDLLEKIRSTVASAKNPEDLDAYLAELLSLGRSGNTPLDGSLLQARAQLLLWQDYLAGKLSGNRDRALQALITLDEVAREGSGFIPRSQLLRLMDEITQPQPEEDLTASVLSIASLDDIREATTALRQSRTAAGNSLRDQLLESLGSLDKVHREYLAGMPVSIRINDPKEAGLPGEISAKLTELRSKLLKEILPRYVGAPSGTNALDSENVATLLERLETEASSALNLGLLQRTREARFQLYGISADAAEDAALQACLAAQNQEEAAQFTPAVISYQEALKSGSDVVPARAIGQKLEAIKASHPEDYERGVSLFLHPEGISDARPGSEPKPAPASLPIVAVPLPADLPAPSAPEVPEPAEEPAPSEPGPIEKPAPGEKQDPAPAEPEKPQEEKVAPPAEESGE